MPLCVVYRSTGQFEETAWKDVKVGDLVELHSEDTIPADLLLIHSSDQSTHTCFVETANLDGETNLKQRFVPRTLGIPEVGLLAITNQRWLTCERR